MGKLCHAELVQTIKTILLLKNDIDGIAFLMHGEAADDLMPLKNHLFGALL